jgi:hypothetical protein
MKTVGTSSTIPESRLSRQMAANGDSAANEEEFEEQIDEDNVMRAASENATGFPIPTTRGNEVIQAADNAAASREEVEEQVERKRVEKEAFENRISAASAEKWIRRGRTHD